MYKLILFDLDGTILDSDEMIVATFLEIYKDYKPDYKPDIKKILTFSGPPMSETMKQEFPTLDSQKMVMEFRQRSKKHLVATAKAYPYVQEMLDDLKRLGVHFAIVTNKSKDMTPYTLGLIGLRDKFELEVCPEDTNTVKPDPAGVNLAAHHFGITNKNDILYVGDGRRDFETARNAGIDFALVGWSPRDPGDDAVVKFRINSFKTFTKEIGLE